MNGTQGKRSLPGIAFLDFLTNLLVVFVCLFAITFVLIALKTKPSHPSIDPLGYYVVVATWASGSHDDVDLYVEDPQNQIDYFANPQAGLMHLEQDDLGVGISNTETINGVKKEIKTNQERTVLEGVLAGEYTVNVHLYSKRDPHPIKVTIKLYRLHGPDKTLLSRTVTLVNQGDQATAFRFTLNAAGDFTGSNHLFKNIVYSSTTALTPGSNGNDTGPPSDQGFPN